MKFSLSQSVFFLLFFPLYFLLLIFGETPFGIFLLGTVAALLLFFSSYLNFNHINKLSRYLTTVLIVLVAIGVVSLVVSLSLPLSMNKLVFLIIATSCFVFFATVKKDWLTKEMFSYGVVLVGCVLSIMTTLFLFFPDLVRFLPGLNLLTASYGHNHASIYFLFALPLSFYLWKEKNVWWQSVPFVIILVGLVLSFGRVALLLGVVELILLGVTVPKKLRHWFRWLLVPLVGVLLFFTVLSLFPQLSERDRCIIPVFKMQLCKPLVHERRTAYWTQALRATAEKPLLGWGGGTFALVSKRFYRHPSEFSAYAHNEYLQYFVEYGVVGGIVLLLFFVPVWRRCYAVLRQPSSSFSYFLSIAILALGLDALFDYNWNYVGVWTIFLIGIALFSQQEEVSKLFHTSAKKFSISLSGTVIQWMWIGGSISLLLWSGLYFTHVVARARRAYDFSQRIFPFVYWEAEEDMYNKDISWSTKTFMFQLYRHHSNVITAYVSVAPAEQDKRPLYKQLITVEPFNFTSWKRLLNDDLSQRDMSAVVHDLRSLNETFSGTQKYIISDLEKKNFFEPFITALNGHLFSEPEQVADAYVESYRFYPFLPTETHFEMLQYPLRYPTEKVTWLLTQVPEKQLWRYRESLQQWRVQRLRMAAQQENYAEVEKVLQEIVENTAWGYPEALEVVFRDYIKHIENFHSTQRKERAIPVLSSWMSILMFEPQNPQEKYVNLEWNSRLAQKALYIGKDLVSSQPVQAAQLYLLAEKILPNSTIDYPVLPGTTDTTATRQEVVFVQTLLKSEEGRKLVSQYQFLQLLQRAANTLITQQRDVEAIEILRAMNQLFLNDYIAPSQIGNYYYFRGNAAQARQEFQQCADAQKQIGIMQSLCYEKITAVDEGKKDTQQWYWETSQLILK